MSRWIRARMRRNEKGFTLIELMIVVNTVGILALTAIPSYLGLRDRAMDGANRANIRVALPSIDAYFQDNASYAGMTLTALQVYDAALDLSKFTLTGVTSTTYCIQSPQGSGLHVWRRNGPGAAYDPNHC